MAVSPKLLSRVQRLPHGLLIHCQQVSRVCHELASRHGCDPGKAEMVGLAHDLARAMGDDDLLALAEGYHLTIGLVERRIPLLLHGPVAAEILRREFGIDDAELLEAISCHTTAKGGMSLLAKVLFVGDKTEPGRYAVYPVAGKVAQLAGTNLDGAILEFLNWHIGAVVERGSLLHPDTIEARNEILSQEGISGTPPPWQATL